MKETQARREAASKQLIAHYKSEAERLLTMTINSKSVAQQKRVETLERENLAFQKQVLDLEERLLSCPPAAAASHHHCARSYGGGGERGALQESAAGLEAVSEYPPLGAVKADHARQGLEDEKLELRRLRKLSRAYQMVTGLSLEITPEQKVVATMENDSRAGRLIQFEVRYGRVSTRMPSALEWLLRLCVPRSWTWTRTPRRWSTNPSGSPGCHRGGCQTISTKRSRSR